MASHIPQRFYTIAGLFLSFCLLLGSCNKTSQPEDVDQKKFILRSDKETHITFSNVLSPNYDLGPIGFDYFYNGAGVAIGDINNDGLQDIYFSGNTVADKLYLNQGNWQFRDVTSEMGISNEGPWTNGVSFVDINNDGFLDIYVCRSGHRNQPADRANLLFLNQGGTSFKEVAREFGLDDMGYSTQSYFFDADGDEDLDVLILNRPTEWVSAEEEFDRLLENATAHNRDRLYINEDGLFRDESEERGFKDNFAFSLSASVVDLNNDGNLDIYIANDYTQSDYYYQNDGRGHFTEQVRQLTNHVPFYAMGSDFKDLNGDLFPDGVVVEMLPGDYVRAKTTMLPMLDPVSFDTIMNKKYHYQYMHNALFANLGNGFLSDISSYAGIKSTDWSWAALINDYDNDGLRDIYITNGFRYDFNNRDTQKEWNDSIRSLIDMTKINITPETRLLDVFMSENLKEDAPNIQELLRILPSNQLSNVMFTNNGDFRFENKSKAWGLDQLGFSNGAAIGDLDNDGDLDIVVNNIDAPAFIYENNVTPNNSIRIKLDGPEKNLLGIGATVFCETDNSVQKERLFLSRGYLSSVEPLLHFGIGSDSSATVMVNWGNGKTTIKHDIPSGSLVTLAYSDSEQEESATQNQPLFEEVFTPVASIAEHNENQFYDYSYQVLLPHKFSHEGPALAVGDFNMDGLQDLFVGGATGQPGRIYLQSEKGAFTPLRSKVLLDHAAFEDVAAMFLDWDNDGDNDLYVASGGSEHEINSGLYQDRLYINNDGKLIHSPDLPVINTSASCMDMTFLDNDQLPELFVGSGIIPNYYPFPNSSFVLKDFQDKGTLNIASNTFPDLDKIGIVRSAVFADLDGKKPEELVLAGEWMPIRILQYEGGKYVDQTERYGLDSTNGWWFSITADDLDGDGDMDLIAGNLGDNYKFHASLEKPFQVYSSDFDKNGTYDVVLAKYLKDDRLVPIRGKDCTTEQMPFIKDKFPTFESFANADISKILGDQDSMRLHLQAFSFKSIILENTGNYTFKMHDLPKEVQWSTLRSSVVMDVNKDGIKDLVVAGNMFPVEVETTRADASPGWVLLGKGDMKFETLYPGESGFFAPGDVRHVDKIKIGTEECIIVANNDGPVQLFKISN